MKRPNVSLARSLRRRATDQERMLWARLRGLKALGFHFRRQHPIGPYIVDFVCLSAMLVVEVDGAQHFVGPVALADQERDRILRSMGFEIFRVPNGAVNVAADEVAVGIAEVLKRLAPRVYEAGLRAIDERVAAHAAAFDARVSQSCPPPEIAKGDFGLPQGGGEA